MKFNYGIRCAFGFHDFYQSNGVRTCSICGKTQRWDENLNPWGDFSGYSGSDGGWSETIKLPNMPSPKEVLMFDEGCEVKGFTRKQMRDYAISAVRMNIK